MDCSTFHFPGSDLTNAFTAQQPGGGAGPTPSPATWGYGFQVHLTYFNQEAKRNTMGLVRRAGSTG